jgi:hypothetical protein
MMVNYIKVNHIWALLIMLTASSSPALDDYNAVSIPAVSEDISGAYYDWTKTKQPETPWNFDYNKTLVTKIFLCSRNGDGNVDKVFLKFDEVANVLRKLDNITLGIPKIVYLVGWQYNGHDSKYPAWGEVNESLKRENDNTALESLKWLMNEAKKYNTTISLHINMIDAFKDSPLWDEYFDQDIIAKDSLCNPIKGEVFMGMQSYQISYAREWELGRAQKRIDGLLQLLPELTEAGTIQIDAFHSMRPSGVGEPISPYLDFSIDDEIKTQRKIFRYWQSKGIDVTSEGGMYWLRKDPFIGLQAMAWHFSLSNFIEQDWINKPENFTSLPAIFSASTPMHSEGEIMKDPENLTGLIEQFCLTVVPWYYKRNSDVSTGGDVIITRDVVICPVLWKDKTLVVYSRMDNLKKRSIELPAVWGEVHGVRLFDMTLDGLKHSSIQKVEAGSITIDVSKNRPIIIMPKN